MDKKSISCPGVRMKDDTKPQALRICVLICQSASLGRLWFVLLNVPHALENNVHSCFCWTVFYKYQLDQVGW